MLHTDCCTYCKGCKLHHLVLWQPQTNGIKTNKIINFRPEFDVSLPLSVPDSLACGSESCSYNQSINQHSSPRRSWTLLVFKHTLDIKLAKTLHDIRQAFCQDRIICLSIDCRWNFKLLQSYLLNLSRINNDWDWEILFFLSGNWSYHIFDD